MSSLVTKGFAISNFAGTDEHCVAITAAGNAALKWCGRSAMRRFARVNYRFALTYFRILRARGTNSHRAYWQTVLRCGKVQFLSVAVLALTRDAVR